VGLLLKSEGNTAGLPLAEVQAELAELMAPAGLALEWLSSAQMRTARVSALISVELRGSCDFRKAAPGGFANRTALASTAMADGRVLPFVWVDCTATRRFLGAPLANLPAAERQHAAARAVARLLAHELYHVLSGAEGHTESGIAKASFSQLDLLTGTLGLDPLALARIAPRPAPALAAISERSVPADWVAALGLDETDESEELASGR
jgi:hypothetical protein